MTEKHDSTCGEEGMGSSAEGGRRLPKMAESTPRGGAAGREGEHRIVLWLQDDARIPQPSREGVGGPEGLLFNKKECGEKSPPNGGKEVQGAASKGILYEGARLLYRRE